VTFFFALMTLRVGRLSGQVGGDPFDCVRQKCCDCNLGPGYTCVKREQVPFFRICGHFIGDGFQVAACS